MGNVVGTLYALNTLVAMVGVLAGGFVLIGAIGETNTVFVGVAINWLVAIGVSRFCPNALRNDSSCPRGGSENPSFRIADRARTVLFCFGLSGFVSLGDGDHLEPHAGSYLEPRYTRSVPCSPSCSPARSGGWIGARVERWKDSLLALASFSWASPFRLLSVWRYSSMSTMPTYLCRR